jgi:hypothetical protein
MANQRSLSNFQNQETRIKLNKLLQQYEELQKVGRRVEDMKAGWWTGKCGSSVRQSA